MTDDVPLVRRLQAEAIDPHIPVAKLLRLAKVIATKLDQKDALVWINAELNGYMGRKVEEMPAYRILQGTPKAYHSLRGWFEIHFEDPEDARKFSRAPIAQGIGSIESDFQETKNPTLVFPFPLAAKKILWEGLGPNLEVGLFISPGQAWGIVDAVRNLVLDWSLEFEQAGVLGEGMSFTQKEKSEAQPITNQFIIQNLGVLGNVTDQANVSAAQVAVAALDIRAVQKFAKDALLSMPQLPAEIRPVMGAALEAIRKEAEVKEPNSTKLKQLLNSVRTICEGAASNVAAEGIIQTIKVKCCLADKSQAPQSFANYINQRQC